MKEINYIENSKKYTDEEIDKMFHQYFKTKNEKLEQQLFEANIKFVTHIVSKIVASSFSFKKNLVMSDMLQEGNIGLLLAIRKFDPTRGFKISTYASWYIKAYLYRYILANWNLVKIGTNIKEREAFFKMNKYLSHFNNTSDDSIDNDIFGDYSESLKINKEFIMVLSHRLKNGEINYDDNVNLINYRSIQDDMVNEEYEENTQELLDKCFSCVTNKRALEIFKMRHLDEMSFVDIGNKFGLSRQRIDQIEKTTLAKIKKKMQGMGYSVAV